MTLTPEINDKLKKAAIAGVGLAIASIAMKHNKVIGDKVRHSSFWEASEGFIIDVIGDKKEKIIRLAGTVVRNESGDISDVKYDDDEGLNISVEDASTIIDLYRDD